MATDAQRAAIRKYQAAGKRATITLSMARAIHDDISSYADARGMAVTACIRECVRRCMEWDGWTRPGANRTEPPASDPAQAETAAPGADGLAPAKRKRGRPRKVQAVDMGADGIEANAHNNGDAAGIDADTIAPPRRKRGRPRKVNP